MFGVGVGAVHVVPIGGAGGEFRVAERLDGVSHETGFGYARLGGGLGKQIEQLLVHEDPEGVAVSSHGFIVSLVVAVPGAAWRVGHGWLAGWSAVEIERRAA